MQKSLVKSIDDAILVITQLKTLKSLTFLEATARKLASCFEAGNKVIIAGNGGSLCDGAHFAEELTGVFRAIRPALPVISLSEPGHITCVGNDIGFEWIFARGVQAFGKAGDIFIGMTTSGNSPNIVKAFETAKDLQMQTVAFLGKNGGKLRGIAELELIIENFTTSDRIQEAHMTAVHIIIEMLEHLMFPSKVVSFTDSFVTQAKTQP